MRFACLVMFFLFQAGFSFCLETQNKELNFVIFSDCHLKDTTTIGETILKNIIDRVNLDESKPEFAVCLGDIVELPKNASIQRYNRTIDKYLSITGRLNIPLYTIAGNHDLEHGEIASKIFQEKIGPLFFTLQKSEYLLIFLNSESVEKNSEQMQWLEKIFQKSKEKKIVFMHKPLFAVNLFKSFDIFTTQYLKDFFEKNNVFVIFSGHEHFFYKKIHDRILQIIIGSSGGNVRPAPEGGNSSFQYCRVKISGNKVKVEVVPVEISQKEEIFTK